MKIHFTYIVSVTFSFIACTRQQDQGHQNNFGPKVVEAHGYVVPKDSMAEPKVILIDESKLKKVPAGKPKVIPTRSNIMTAGTPKVVIAGTPRVCTPGQDTFLLPKTVPAIDSPYVAGVPEVVIAKDASTKDQNPGNFSTFGKLQGLKSDFITCIYQDKERNLWFGTNGGISKFDGKYFTHYTEKEGFGNAAAYSILEDRDGNIWFGGFDGAFKYDGKSITHFTEKEGLSKTIVMNILEDRAGNLWFGYYEGGLSKYDGNRVDAIERGENIPFSDQADLKKVNGKLVKSFTHYTEKEGLLSNYTQGSLEDNKGNLWFGSYPGVVMYDGKSFTQFTTNEGLPSKNVYEIIEDQDGNIWFSQYGGACKYDGKSFTWFTKKEGLLGTNIQRILEDRKRNIWFGTAFSGISKYDGNSFTYFTEQEGLSSDKISSMQEDFEGNLWFGTKDGVSKYSGKSFTHFTDIDSKSSADISCMLIDKSGNIWFGTWSEGVSKYDGKSVTHITQKEGLLSNYVNTMLEDKSGNIWFGGHYGLSKYDGKSFTYYTNIEGLSIDDVMHLLEDKSGNIWFSTYGNGVIKYDGKSFIRFTQKEGLSNNVLGILEDKSGNFWFSMNKEGVCKYDGKTFTRFNEQGGLSGNTTYKILESLDGNLWFATDKGVSKYDGKTFTHFTEKEGLSNNNVYDMLQDKSGNIWFGTTSGLSELPANKLAELSENGKSTSLRAETTLFKNYTTDEGFTCLDCSVTRLQEDKTGKIYIATTDGLMTYNPPVDNDQDQDQNNTDTLAPNIQLTSVKLYNEQIQWSLLQNKMDTGFVLGNGVAIKDFRFDSTSKWYFIPQHLNLAYNNNDITFNFIGITQKSPKKVKYQYLLEGNDKNWSVPSYSTEAPYGNLPHGHYTFKVKAMSGDGYWSDEFHYPFTIRPPWWLTWWAYTLYALGIITLLWRLHKFQQARTLRIERERTQVKELAQAKEIEKAYTELKATQKQLIQSEKMASLGELTAGIAHEIQNPLNFVNNFSEVNKELLVEMNEEIEKGNLKEVKAIAKDVTDNEEKILFHGKRADAIVKGMLQHSRSSNGVKEPTDINALADEYLRLAYHGLRAKDKTFNAKMKTDYDESIGFINVVPQDIGRVILNLITNAFYAVCPPPPEGGLKTTRIDYEPTVIITTRKLKSPSGDLGAEISVKDNGSGIAQNILDKIFQPFFTTKPTGQGTGLGLSLSYDIIKAHGGELKVETKEGEGSEFIIQLPLN